MARAIARFELVRPLKRSHITAEQLDESSWEPLGLEAFRAAWIAEVEEARSSHKRERLHLATGLLLPVWDKLPSDFVRVSRISASDGRSLLGREVPLHCVPELCRALGLEHVQTLSADDIVQSVLATGRAMEVKAREPLVLKRSLVNGAQRLELTGWSAARLDWYKAQGCFTEIIRYQTRLFVPLDGAAGGHLPAVNDLGLHIAIWHRTAYLEPNGVLMMLALQPVETVPQAFRPDPVTQEEAAAMFRAAVNLFGKWQLTDEQAATLLDMPVRSYRRWKAEGPGRISRDGCARLSNLMGIHKALRIIFSEPQRGYAWIKAGNAAFAGASALDVMLGGELTDIMRVRRYLDATRGGW